MENNIQDLVNQENKQNKIEHKKEERQKKINSFFERISASREKRKAKLEAIRKAKEEKAAKLAEEKRKKQEYQDSCNEKYQKFLELSKNPEVKDQIITDENGQETHIVQGEFGYIVSTSHVSIAYRHKCTGSHSYEGFASMIDDKGVKQTVYVNIKKESFDPYDYGPHGDYYSPKHDTYKGFIRNAKGSFVKVNCTIASKSIRDFYSSNYGDVSSANVTELYSSIEESYKNSVSSINID